MDTQTAINILMGAVSAISGWFAREMWAAVKELKTDLAALREEIPSHYVRRDDFKEGIKEVKEMLNKIFDKLDSKVDK